MRPSRRGDRKQVQWEGRLSLSALIILPAVVPVSSGEAPSLQTGNA